MQGKYVSIRRDRGGRAYPSIGRCSTKILRLKGTICTGETGDELICCKNGTESITAARCDVQIAVHRRLLIPHAHPNKRAGMTSISSRSRREWLLRSSHGSHRMLYIVGTLFHATADENKESNAGVSCIPPPSRAGTLAELEQGGKVWPRFCPEWVIFPVAATLQARPQNLG